MAVADAVNQRHQNKRAAAAAGAAASASATVKKTKSRFQMVGGRRVKTRGVTYVSNSNGKSTYFIDLTLTLVT